MQHKSMFNYDEEFEDYQGYPEPYRPQYSRYDAGDAVGQVVQALSEFAQTLEHEKSNRADIERKRKVAIELIRSERSVMIHYLHHRFGERVSLYEQYFHLVDTALQLENEAIVNLALENILNIYQDNPCANLDEFRQQFDAMNEVVRI